MKSLAISEGFVYTIPVVCENIKITGCSCGNWNMKI